MKKTVIFCSVVVALALIACAAILVKPSIVLRNGSGVRVKGTAVARVQSDAMAWSGSLVGGLKPTIKEAVYQVEKHAVLAKELFAKNKLDDVEFSTTRWFTTYKRVDGKETNEIEGYTASIYLSFKPKTLEQAKKLSECIGELLKNNVSAYDNGTSYFYTKLESLKMQLLEKAAANAKERAQKLVSGSGSNLGGVISASQGVFQITPPLSTNTSDWGTYDTTTYEKDVKCVVTMEFATK